MRNVRLARYERDIPTVHLIHGYLGAGKTTFACNLERDLPAIRFTHDEWMARLYGEDPPVNDFPVYYRRVSDQIGTLWPRCLELGVDVVLDLNFWSRAQRDSTRATALTLGANVVLYRLICAEEEAWRRIDDRNRRLEGNLFIDRNTFNVLQTRFEPLGDDEERTEIR